MSLPAPQWNPPAAVPALAGFGRRIFAYAVDLLLFAVPAFFFLLATTTLEGDDAMNGIRLASLVLGAAFTVYQTVMVALRGQTVGGMCMSIAVVRIDTGVKPGWAASGIRALVPQVVGLVPYIGVVLELSVYGWMFFDPRRQGLHDKAAGTLVIARR